MPRALNVNDSAMDAPAGNTAMDNCKDSAGIVVAKKDSAAKESEYVKAPWRPWEGPAHAVQSGASPVQGRPAVRVSKPALVHSTMGGVYCPVSVESLQEEQVRSLAIPESQAVRLPERAGSH